MSGFLCTRILAGEIAFSEDDIAALLGMFRGRSELIVPQASGTILADPGDTKFPVLCSQRHHTRLANDADPRQVGIAHPDSGMIARGGRVMPIRGRGILGTITLLFDILLYLWAGARIALDIIGRAIVVDDFSSPTGFMARAVTWLFQTPWYVPTLLAAATTIVLIGSLLRGSGQTAMTTLTPALPSSTVQPLPISGIEFYETRKELDRKYPSVSDRLQGVSAAWAMWAVGTRFIDSPADKRVLKRLILPNPDGKSAKLYFDTIHQEHARLLIRPTTLKAIAAKIEVRWSDYFTFHSITIAGPVDPDGWAYIEHALPYYATDERPGYTIHRKDQPEAFRALVEKFSKIWDNTKVPTDEELMGRSAQLEPMYKAISYVALRISDRDATKFWPLTRRVIRQAALDGKIQIYGHKSEDTGNSGATSWSLMNVPIPRAYWALADITESATSPEHADELMHNTRPQRLSDGRFTPEQMEYYAKLTVNWSDVTQNWP